jgi:hypothetical protein
MSLQLPVALRIPSRDRVTSRLGTLPSFSIRSRRHSSPFFSKRIGLAVAVGANHIFDNAFIEAGPNLLVCSDIFAKYLGWVEGGIASAKAASEHLLLNRPFNSE